MKKHPPVKRDKQGRIVLPNINLSEIKTPIFIIVKDRLTVLKKIMKSFKNRIKTPFEIIIHDNGSTYKPTLEFLKKLENQGIRVYYHKNTRFYSKIQSLGRVNISVQDYLKEHTDVPFYCVTDPDVAFHKNTPGDILEFYASVLDQYFPNMLAAGPIMKIDNIPDHYPFKHTAIKRYKNLHFKVQRHKTVWRKRQYDIYFKRIETTFAIYKRGYNFGMYKKAVRCHTPCDALHLDWYLDPNNLTDDQKYYIANQHDSPFISHWGGQFMRKFVISQKELRRLHDEDEKHKQLAKQGKKGEVK